MHALSLTSRYVSITCLLCTHVTAFDACLLIWIIYTHVLYTSLGMHLNICWGVSDSPGLACSGSEAWIEVEPSTENQAYLSEQAD